MRNHAQPNYGVISYRLIGHVLKLTLKAQTTDKTSRAVWSAPDKTGPSSRAVGSSAVCTRNSTRSLSSFLNPGFSLPTLQPFSGRPTASEPESSCTGNHITPSRSAYACGPADAFWPSSGLDPSKVFINRSHSSHFKFLRTLPLWVVSYLLVAAVAPMSFWVRTHSHVHALTA